MRTIFYYQGNMRYRVITPGELIYNTDCRKVNGTFFPIESMKVGTKSTVVDVIYRPMNSDSDNVNNGANHHKDFIVESKVNPIRNPEEDLPNFCHKNVKYVIIDNY